MLLRFEFFREWVEKDQPISFWTAAVMWMGVYIQLPVGEEFACVMHGMLSITQLLHAPLPFGEMSSHRRV